MPRVAFFTLWRDLESVYAFAYYGDHHAGALRRRKEWFVEGAWVELCGVVDARGHDPELGRCHPALRQSG